MDQLHLVASGVGLSLRQGEMLRGGPTLGGLVAAMQPTDRRAMALTVKWVRGGRGGSGQSLNGYLGEFLTLRQLASSLRQGPHLSLIPHLLFCLNV